MYVCILLRIAILPTNAEETTPGGKIKAFQSVLPTLRSVAIADNGNIAFAVGDQGIILQWENGTWKEVAQGLTDAKLNSVSLSADGKRGFAVGTDGTILRFESGSWETVADRVTDNNIFSVSISSDGESAIAVGANRTLLEFAHKRWVKSDNSELTDRSLRSVSLSADGSVGFAVGGNGVIVRYKRGLWSFENGSWSKEADLPIGKSLVSVSLDANGQHGFAIATDGTVVRFENDAWEVDWPTHVGEWRNNNLWISSDGKQALAINRAGKFYAFNGENWTPVPERQALRFIYSLALTKDGTEGFAVGVNGVIWRFHANAWEVVRSGPTRNDISSLSLAANGRSGFAVGKHSTILALNGNKWALYSGTETFDDLVDLESVAIDERGLNAFAVGDAGTILRLRNGMWEKIQEDLTEENLNCVSITPDGRYGVIVGSNGLILGLSHDRWIVARAAKEGNSDLLGVSISAAGNRAYAVGRDGVIFGYENGAWKDSKVNLTHAALNAVSLSEDGNSGIAVGDDSTILRMTNGNWELVQKGQESFNDDFNGVTIDRTGLQGFVVTADGSVLRTADGGRIWFAIDETVDPGLTSIGFDKSYTNGWAVGENGSIMRTEVERASPDVEVGMPSVSGGEVKFNVKVPEKDNIQVVVSLEGTALLSDWSKSSRKFLTAAEANGGLSWKKSTYFGTPTKYTFDVNIFDGWNIVREVRDLDLEQNLWEAFRDFMRWHIPKDFKELKDIATVNSAALLALYFLTIVCLYLVAPAQFAAWHEWIANGKIPFSEKVVKVLAPLFLGTPYCLNAVVRRHRERALGLFESVDEVKLRPKWIPAPMTIGDEPITEYKRPADLPARQRYVAGLFELKAAFAPRGRLSISIDGPGGVGKSSLAFQIARWACENRPQYRLASYPMLPVLVGSDFRSGGPSKVGGGDDESKNRRDSVDEAAASNLELIMETPRISADLLQALLRKKRVLVVVDGVSEMNETVMSDAIRPDRGAKDSRALVVTSRVPTGLPDSVVIKPQSLTLKFLDRVLDPLIEVTVGSGRFEGDQRETLRDRLKDLMQESGDGLHERQLPMIFLRLMIERANQLLNDGKELNALPRTLAELVNSYTEQLLAKATDNLVALMKQAREAAKVCMGAELTPGARSQEKYIQAGLSLEALKVFITSGLMTKFGEASDPFYKFALDPVAEQLSVNRLVFALRDGTAEGSEINELRSKWEGLPPEFVSLFRHTAAAFRADIDKPGSPLAARLFDA
jgi:photosystem II stability/assembly factor-like uncharacterized protein